MFDSVSMGLKVARVYFKLYPYFKKIGEATKMKFSVNMFVQILTLVAQGANQVLSFVPDAKKPVVVAALGVVSAVTGLLAHFSNPNGTPASQPYTK